MGYCKTDFMNYMKKTVSPYHAVAAGAEILEAAGFQAPSPRIRSPYAPSETDNTPPSFRLGLRR